MHVRVLLLLAAGVLVSAGAADAPVLLGRLQTRAAAAIASSDWSIGGETLDRDFAVYGHYKAWLGPLGAKHIRLQAGWSKCEKTPGHYDFAWLDAIVDDARAQGVQPWLELSYGNTNYPGGGGTGLGGGLPLTPGALAAWDRWVAATVTHFRDRVTAWEIWNEPDLGKQNDPADYAALLIRTAEIVRRLQPQAKIYALALAGRLPFAEQFFSAVQARGRLDLIDAITVHGYPKNPDDTGLADQVRVLAARFSPHIQVRQGETGAPSRFQPNYALAKMEWTENMQAKWNLRRMLAHHAKGYPVNLFTLCDLHYLRDGKVDMNYKGLLATHPDQTVARAKPSYRAAQNVFTLFDATLGRVTGLVCLTSVTNELKAAAFRRAHSGGELVALWFSGAPVTDDNARTPVDVTLRGVQFRDPVLVDLLDGRVHAMPDGSWKREEAVSVFHDLPLYDAPVLVAERELIPMAGEP